VRNRIPALLALLICLPLVAGGNLFRWRDADGKLHIGDNLPAEAIQKGYDIIDERGRVLKHVDPPPSPEELRKRREAARKAELERQRRVAQAERDRALLLTYGSVAEIERARDERLNLIRSQIRVNRDRLQQLEKELEQLQQNARRNFLDKKRKLPPMLAERIERKQAEIATTRKRLQRYEQSYARIKARFEKDIRRFRELEAARKKIRQRAASPRVREDDLR